MRPAAITAAIFSLVWLIWRKSTTSDTCCPHCDWEVSDDELNYIAAKPWDDSKLDALLGDDE